MALSPVPTPTPAAGTDGESAALRRDLDDALDEARHRVWLAVPWVYTRRNDPWLLGFIERMAGARRRGLDVRAYVRPYPDNAYAVGVWREAGVLVVQDTPGVRYPHTKRQIDDIPA